jgi:hypothetical protein
MVGGRQQVRNVWPILGVIMLAGLLLRLLAAQGGLWLDEAWSAQHALEVGTPLGVFVGINHDNNHHLNSLWMLLAGADSSPVWIRALSIATSTATIAVGATIAASRGRVAMIVTAWFLALSPMLVTLGSEARGYAPMLLAFAAAILVVDRWLAEPRNLQQRVRIALLFAIGLLCQLTMVFGICALVGWAAWLLWRRHGLRAASGLAIRFFAPALLIALAIAGGVLGAAYASGTGFRFGSYTPFALTDYLSAIAQMLGFTFGFRWVDVWPIALALCALVAGTRTAGSRAPLYWFAIIGFPVTLALLKAGNVGYPRYYVVAAIALLLFAGDTISYLATRPGWRRWLAGVALLAFTAGALAQNVALIREQRGDPDRAIAAMKAQRPQGAYVLIPNARGTALVEMTARRSGYPLRIGVDDCGTLADFVFLDRYRREPIQPSIMACGHSYQAVVSADSHGLSGTPWTLYRVAR